MLYLLDQVHFHFNPCPEIVLRIYPPFRHLRLYSDDFAGMVVAIIHIDNLVHFTLSSFSKPSKLRISDNFILFRFKWGFEPSIMGVVGGC